MQLKKYSAFISWLVFLSLWILLKTTTLITTLDKKIFAHIQPQRTSFGDTFMTWITYAGDWKYILIGCLILCLIALYYKQKKIAIFLTSTFIGVELLSVFFKVLINRDRPFHLLKSFFNYDMSFPSGHSTLATAFYGALLYLCYPYLKKTYQKILGFIIYVGLIISIAFSRLYLGAHWFTDVVAGISLGLGWLLIVIMLYEHKRIPYKNKYSRKKK